MITIKEASVFIGHHPVSRNLRLLQARRVPHSILPRGAIHRGAVARARPRLPSFSRSPSLSRSLATPRRSFPSFTPMETDQMKGIPPTLLFLPLYLSMYRVTMVVVHLGWVDSDLGSSPGWWAVTAATCCPTGGWNIPNLSQQNPGAQPPWSPCTCITLFTLLETKIY